MLGSSLLDPEFWILTGLAAIVIYVFAGFLIKRQGPSWRPFVITLVIAAVAVGAYRVFVGSAWSSSMRNQPMHSSTTSASTRANHFPWGYGTWYVSQRRSVPWFGHARHWYQDAKAWGFSVGQTPVAGAIYVSREPSIYGLVGYVESVNRDGSFTISEMNYLHFGAIDHRTIPAHAPSLVGFIY